MHQPLSIYLGLGILAASLALSPSSGSGDSSPARRGRARANDITQPIAALAPRMRPGAASVPVAFEANRGQFDPKIQYRARDSGYELLLERGGIRFASHGSSKAAGNKPDSILVRFEGSPTALEWRGQDALPGRANYFRGNDKSRWRTNVPLYSGAGAIGMTSGVDCLVYVGDRGLEMDFDVAPETDLSRLRLQVSGARRMRLSPEGDLLITGNAAEIRLRNPAIYQVISGHRASIRGGYALISGTEVGFRAEKYDRRLPLVIDPSVAVTYTTFLGGAGADSANSVALDSSGAVYISGTTTAAATFPEQATQTQFPIGGINDFFVAKIDPTKTDAASLVYLTFIGGSRDEEGGRLAVDSSGQVALAGTTVSTDYPVTDSTKRVKGFRDLALSVLNPAGNAFVFSTVLDATGSAGTIGTPAIAFSPKASGSENVFVAADITASDLPITAGAFAPTYGGGITDGMLGVYSPSGSLNYLTYFGINGFTDINGIAQTVTVGVNGLAVDLLGHAYVAGWTSQPGSGFPVTNGFQTTYAGGPFDAFLLALKPKGLGAGDLIYSTFLGGTQSDQAFAVAVDQAIPANAYIAGTTASPDALTDSAPAVTGYQSTLHGDSNAFLVAVAQSQTGAASLSYASYLGGSASDSALSVISLGSNAVFVTGRAGSFDFPTLNTLQSFSGTADAFLAKLDTTAAGAASLLYSTLLGGGGDSQGNGVAALPTGQIAIAGSTTANDFPLAGNSQNGVQPICDSCQATPSQPDAFIMTFAESAASGPVVSFNAPQLNFGNQLVGMQNPPQVGILTNVGTAPMNLAAIAMTGANASDFSQSNDCPLSPATLAPQASCQLTVNFSPTVPGAETAAIRFTDDAVGSPQGINLTGTGQEPLVTVSAATINFGNQPQGTVSNAQTLTLTNSGNLALNFAVINMNGPDVAQFRFTGSNTCANPPLVQPGATCIMNVAFAPQTMGPFNASIVLADNSGNMPAASQAVALAGIGTPAAPTADISSNSLNFGSATVSTTSGPQSVALSNTGSLPLQISSVSLSGANASEFKVAAGTTCPIGGGTVATSASCNVNIVFTPASTGTKAATLSFFDNVTGSPQTVALTGAAVSASIALSSTSLSFQAQTLKTPSPNSAVTLTNPSATAVQVSSIGIAGPNSADFLQTNNCPATLGPAGTCQVSVVFQPLAGGARTASLTFVDTAAGSPQKVNLAGTGLVPAVTLSAAAINFAPQLAGISSPAAMVTLMNAGNGGLVISSLALSGANQDEFTATQNCGAMLAPAASCAVSVVFEPQAGQAGSAAAVVSIIDNALDSPEAISLTGAVADFSIGASTSGSLSAVVNAGGTADFSLQVNSLNGFAGSVALTCSGAPQNSTCGVSPSPVAAAAAAPTPFTVKVATNQATAAALSVPTIVIGKNWLAILTPATSIALAVLAFLISLGVAAIARRRRDSRQVLAWTYLAVLFAAAALTSCTGSVGRAAPSSSQITTPAGTYTLTVTGAFTPAGATQAVDRTVQLTLAVQ